MAVFKCKMCGAQLDISELTIATCDYCGSQQTLPKLNDDKVEKLYERANNFRQGNEFDKAMAVYEEILNENPDDSESYWSLVLCKYGIEYVEDPQNHKRVPTVNRAQYTSIFDDNNYKLAIQYADLSQRMLYEEEAKTINEIQRGILEISQKEEPFDVFICYKETDERGTRTRDSVYANELYHELTNEGFKVFFSRITLEDKLGVAYEPYIFAALNSARVMVVLGTKPEYFNAVWVKNEWSRYLTLIKNGEKKVIIPAYKDMDPYDLPKEFSHLQAQDMNKLGFMPDLIRGIKKILGYNKKPAASYEESASPSTRGAGSASANTASLMKRAYIFLEDQDWKNASAYCEKVLDIEPENADAYICKLLALVGGTEESHLAYSAKPLDTYPSYKNALRFADDETAQRLADYNRQVKERLENEARAREERKLQKKQDVVALSTQNSENQLVESDPFDKKSIQKRISKLKSEKSSLMDDIKKTNKKIFTEKEASNIKTSFIFSIVGFIVAYLMMFVIMICAVIPYVGWLFFFVAGAAYIVGSLIGGIKAFKSYRKPVILALPNVFVFGLISLPLGIVCKIQSSPKLVAKNQAKLSNMQNRLDQVTQELETEKINFNIASGKAI